MHRGVRDIRRHDQYPPHPLGRRRMNEPRLLHTTLAVVALSTSARAAAALWQARCNRLRQGAAALRLFATVTKARSVDRCFGGKFGASGAGGLLGVKLATTWRGTVGGKFGFLRHEDT